MGFCHVQHKIAFTAQASVPKPTSRRQSGHIVTYSQRLSVLLATVNVSVAGHGRAVDKVHVFVVVGGLSVWSGSGYTPWHISDFSSPSAAAKPCSMPSLPPT